jgi:hypothetical protein
MLGLGKIWALAKATMMVSSSQVVLHLRNACDKIFPNNKTRRFQSH